LGAALNDPVYARIDGDRRKITKRKAIVTQMVGQKAGTAAPPAPAKLTPAAKGVVDQFVARLRGQIAAEAAGAADPSR
jgi:hypothetical protein